MIRRLRHILTTIFVAAIGAVACAPDSDNYSMNRYFCNFEGSYWNALVDSPQYMGNLLYSETPYSWYDEKTDLASDSTNSEYDGVYYWGNGSALSNYFTTDYNSASTFMEQLTVCAESAHSGNNCIVCTGYYSGSGDFRPTIYFKNGRSYIESMMVANTTYLCYAAENGFRMAEPLADNQSIWIEAEGFTIEEGKETSAGISNFYLYKDGKPAFKGWKKWYITSLPMVDKVKFNLKWNGEGDYNYPAYFALDDIVVVRRELIK